MQFFGVILSALTVNLAALAADPIPKSDGKVEPKAPVIKFNDVTPPVPAPAPGPMPAPPVPDPGAVQVLNADSLYVAVQSDTPFLLFASPANIVTITKESGPIKVRGRFSDGAGKYETRTLSAKYLAIVEAAGTGRVELIAIPVGADAESGATRKLLDVNDGTKPIPPPTPEPIPPPKPKPPPVPPDPKPAPTGAGAFIVVIADDSVNMTVAAAKLYDGPTLRAYKAAGKCRVYGSEVDKAKITALKYDAMMAAEGMTAPCALVVTADGHPVAAFTLTTEAALAAKLKEAMAP